jgi:hypothetical protein
MTVAEYLDAVTDRLLTDRLIAGFHIVRERRIASDGYLRVRLTLVNGGRLEFSEYVRLSGDGEIEVVTYSYHWADQDGVLVKRWDNTPHHPQLAGFPHHVHVGPEETVAPGRPMNLFAVLEEIATLLPSEGDDA